MVDGICSTCLKRVRCLINCNAHILKCASYTREPDFGEFYNALVERIADLVVERIKEANEQENKECESRKAL